MLLQLNGHISTTTLQTLEEILPRGVGVIIAAKHLGRQNLEWDFQKAHTGVMVKCPHTFGHIV